MIEKRYCLTPEEWAYAKAELVLAEKLGLIENADIEVLEKRCAEKNEENARLEMEKKVFYGPRRYSLPMYLQYCLLYTSWNVLIFPHRGLKSQRHCSHGRRAVFPHRLRQRRANFGKTACSRHLPLISGWIY